MNPIRQKIRLLVRARDDMQDGRKRFDNRLGLKADGTLQDTKDENKLLSPEDYLFFEELRTTFSDGEKKTDKELLKELRKIPVYNEFLLNVKGVGTAIAGWIISEYDIEIATTVSKMWQFTGLNPGFVYGKKRVEKGKIFSYVTTDTLVRGDKLTSGFVSPFNKKLRTVMCGILADGFIKCKSSYALDYYYPYKARLEQKDSLVMHCGKEVSWKDVTKGHRDRAAKRYMIKMFLLDLYVAWRNIEGLSVRVPYAEEFLGKKHEVAVAV